MVLSRWIGLFLALLIVAPLAHAAYSVDVVPIKNEILANESALFEVTISNYQSEDSRFQVYSIDPYWSIKTQPVTPIIPAGSEETFTLTLRPTGDADTGVQGLSVTFKDLASGSLIKKDIVLNLRSGQTFQGEYLAAVALNIVMPYEVDPRSAVPIRMELRNRNALNISHLSVYVNSPHFESEFTMNLPPLSERTKDLPSVQIDPLTPPGEAEMSIQIVHEGEVINQLEKNYRIMEYTSIRQRVDEQVFFFKTTKTITVVNDGNVGNTAVVSIPTSFVKSLFVSSTRQHERGIEDGVRVMQWSVPLDPNEGASFTYTENYRVLVLFFILAALAGIAYLFLRSPVVVLKEAVGIATVDGVSRVKVRIFVKNRSAKLIRDLQITDRVPSLADVVKTESPGSIVPNKIAVSEKKGTLLRWNMELLEPYEERVLTYQAKSKLKVIGKMSLPNAKTKFTVRGKERVVFSNNIEIVEKFKDK